MLQYTMTRRNSAHSNDNVHGQSIYTQIPGHADNGGRSVNLRRAQSCLLPNHVLDSLDYRSFHSLNDCSEKRAVSSQSKAKELSVIGLADELLPDVVFTDEPDKSDRSRSLDGGWGWMCVFGCWFMHFLLGGFGRSFGVVYVEMLEHFHCSATTGSTIGGLFTAIRMGAGPLVSVGMKRFSIRTVAIVGAIIFAAGSIMCAFATSTTYMFISYGLLSGLGGALVYFPSVIIVGQYFDRRKGVAMGLSTAGSGIGCIAMPPLYRIMFDDYGWRGTFIIVGGVLLNLLVCAALYRPVEHSLRGKKFKKTSSAPIQDKITSEIAEVRLSESLKQDSKVIQENQSPDDECFLYQNEDTAESASKCLRIHRNSEGFHGSETRDTSSEDVATSSSEKSSEKFSSSEKSIFLREIRNDGKIVDNSPTISILSLPENCCAKVSGWFDLGLLLQPVFLSYLLALTLATMAYLSAQNLILAHAIENGVDAHISVLVLSIVGISDTVGRVLSGVVYDVPFVRQRRSYFYAFILVGSGLSILGWAFCTNFIELAVLSVANGVFNGAIVAGRPVIVADLVGMGKMTSAFGYTVFCQGVGVMVGPFFAGYLKDLTGTYFMSFLFASVCSCLGGLTFFLGYSGAALSRRRLQHRNRDVPTIA